MALAVMLAETPENRRALAPDTGVSPMQKTLNMSKSRVYDFIAVRAVAEPLRPQGVQHQTTAIH